MNISPALKLQIESGIITFISTFLVAAGDQVTHLTGGAVTVSAIIALVISAAQVAVRALYNSIVPISIGSELKSGKLSH